MAMRVSSTHNAKYRKEPLTLNSSKDDGFFRIIKISEKTRTESYDEKKDKKEKPKFEVRGRTLSAFRHNKRQKQSNKPQMHIDGSRTHLNYALHGLDSVDEIKHFVEDLIEKNVKNTVRKDCVTAFEILFSLPVSWHKKDSKTFFKDCCEWTLKTFDGVLICFDVHLDESAPHAHAIVLPLRNGRMQGNAILGYGKRFHSYRKRFYIEVGFNYGLKYIENRTLTRQCKLKLRDNVLNRLRFDSIYTSVLWPLVSDQIRKNPLPFFEFLGLRFDDILSV